MKKLEDYLYYHEDGPPVIDIYLGDCLEIIPLLPKVDLVVTDPPYGEVNRQSSGLRNLDKGDADILRGGEIDAIISIDAFSFYVWCGTEQVSYLRKGFVDAGCSTRLGIWEKSNPSPMNGQHLWLSGLEQCVFARKNGAVFNENCKSPIWKGSLDSKTDHPTEKPLWLFKKLMLASSNEFQSVLDPFLGSGTTLVACKELKRNGIGIEINEKYCEIAKKRLQNTQVPMF
jgi:site-specific DNA-methyltransferase (adenine-specific)